MIIDIAIVDDEQFARDSLEGNIREFEKTSEIKFKITKFNSGIDFLNENRIFGIVFFDIEMPFMNGIDVAQRLRKKDNGSILVFVTKLPQYAIRGYEVNAVDFIVKPIIYSTFIMKFAKIVAMASMRATDSVIVTVNNGKVRLLISDIAYIEIRKHKITYHTLSGEYDTWGSLKKIYEPLKSLGFTYCNGSQIVNISYVSKVVENSVFVSYGGIKEELSISRLKRKEFYDKLTLDFTGII